MANLRNLPIGLDEFSMLRTEDLLYVDKTSQIQKLIETGKRYFLARPRGFGKSLTLSTLAAMFRGESQLFKGLAAEEWVRECAKRPYPVLRFDFSTLSTKNAEYFEQSLQKRINSIAKQFSIKLETINFEESLIELFDQIYSSLGYIVILIDDYDTPVINTLDNYETLFNIYRILKSFYEILDRYNKYSKFLMITGQEKFTKNGIFSTVYNIQDISSDLDFFDLVGFTEPEFISNFSEWIEISAKNINVNKDYLFQKLTNDIQDYYNHKALNAYHPFSLLTCLQAKKLDEYINFLEINTSNASHIYTCINQGDRDFREIRNSKIYVDKSELLIYTNQLLESDNKYICISRPRRFGKTFTAKMISAYYDQSGQAQIAFKGLKITKNSSFNKHANKYIVIKITI